MVRHGNPVQQAGSGPRSATTGNAAARGEATRSRCALAGKRRRPPGVGTLPTHGPLFVVLLIGAVVLIALLNYIPALALGPGIEHLSIVAH